MLGKPMMGLLRHRFADPIAHPFSRVDPSN